MKFPARLFLCASALGTLAACATPHPAPEQQVAVVEPDRPHGDGGVSAFYQPPAQLPSGPGNMIRTEEIQGKHLPDNAGLAVRTLYTSVSGVGDPAPVAVSGQIIFPKGTPPKGGWPIVAWEHGTTGIADICAPSWRGYFSRDRAYLDRWLAAGFAVVASDYQGLGTPGPHPYLMYRPEGYSVLNGLRASLQQYKGTLRNQIVLVGQSQGGGAALGTGWLAPQYAPDLHVLGTVATGVVIAFHVPANTAHPQITRDNPESPHMSASYGILTVEGSMTSLHPEADVRQFMTEKGKDLSHQARQSCLGDLFKYTNAHDMTEENVFTGDRSPLEQGFDTAFTIPDAHLKMPVFVGTGLADDEAGVSQQYDAVAAMCDAGTPVTWKQYPGLTHNGAVNVSADDSVPFALSLLKGVKPRGNCRTIKPISKLEKPLAGVRWNN
ncbi:lipase [Gluconobacter sp. R75690]|uniref:lipase family protein n=1 Tax=Gluconobacter TaxID=441 RepID=UPI00188CDD23|nr:MULTISPECIES: lipase family protein [unclassified Gluconobacter]MBF0850145.1 lipase [Gluconobacter sp. R75690]MBF0879020.1 lipase [Gluconobacter sp. R75828]